MPECPVSASGEASAFGCGDLTDQADYARVARHLHDCAECREVAGEHHRLGKLLERTRLDEPVPPTLTFESVVRRMEAECEPREDPGS